MDYRNPTQCKSMHGRIVQELGRQIVSGVFAPGQRLSAEPALCETYGVRRPVLREATRVPSPKVSSCQSRAWAASCARVTNGTCSIPTCSCGPSAICPKEGAFFQSLMTVRQIIEPAAALTAIAATDEDIERIGTAYARMEDAQTADALLEPDLAFHCAILAATHNDMLAYIGNML